MGKQEERGRRQRAEGSARFIRSACHTSLEVAATELLLISDLKMRVTKRQQANTIPLIVSQWCLPLQQSRHKQLHTLRRIIQLPSTHRRGVMVGVWECRSEGHGLELCQRQRGCCSPDRLLSRAERQGPSGMAGCNHTLSVTPLHHFTTSPLRFSPCIPPPPPSPQCH